MRVSLRHDDMVRLNSGHQGEPRMRERCKREDAYTVRDLQVCMSVACLYTNLHRSQRLKSVRISLQ